MSLNRTGAAAKVKRPLQEKKRMSGEDRRAQIVRVASAIFAKNGFRGATTREIAKKAGISEAVIFKHFSRKEDLYKAIIDNRCTDTEGEPRLLKMLEGKKGRVVFEGVATYLISEHQRDSSFLRLLTFSALERHEFSEIFIKTKGLELFGFIESHIKTLIDEGVFRRVDPGTAAAAFMGMVLHYSISQEIYDLKKFFSWPIEHVVSSFVDIFLEGMKRR